MALVLFFVPNPHQAVREMVRVVKDGGTIAAYQWDLAGGGFPLQPILDAVHAEGYKSQSPRRDPITDLSNSGLKPKQLCEPHRVSRRPVCLSQTDAI